MKKVIFLVPLLVLTLVTHAQVDRSVMPKPGPPPEIQLGSAQSFELQSGLKVMVVEDHKLPRISTYLILDNPPILEGKKTGVASLTGSLLGKGSVNIPKEAFYEEVDFLGASISFGAQRATARSLKKYFPRIMELLAEAAIYPNFNQDDFDTEKARLLTSLKNEEKDVKAIADRLQAALSYGTGHPYGEFVTEESVNRVTLADVEEFYRNYFVPANAYLVVIGDTDLEEVQDLVSRYFVSWTKAVPPSYSYTRPANAAFKQINFVDMPNAVQSEIRVVSLVDLKMNDPDYLPALLANRIFGGGAQGRLNQNIREDKGYAYYAYSSLGNDKYAPATFTALTSVRNSVTDSTVVQLLQELDSINKPTITEEELNNVKAEYTGSFVLDLEKPETIARYALNIETENLPADFYSTYLERLNAVTVEQVQQAARKYIKADKIRIVIAGKGSEVLEGLEAVSQNARTLPIRYYDKMARQVEKPTYDTGLPEGLSVEGIINRYLSAIGGAEALASVTSLKLVYEGEAMGSVIRIVELLEDNKFAQTTYMNDAAVMGLVASDGQIFMKQGANKLPLPPAMQEEMRNTLGLFPEQKINENPAARLAGIEKVGDRDAYRIDVPGEVVHASYFFDRESGLKLKESIQVTMNGQTQSQEILYADYQDVEGIKVPGIRYGTVAQQEITSKLVEAVVNEDFPDTSFE